MLIHQLSTAKISNLIHIPFLLAFSLGGITLFLLVYLSQVKFLGDDKVNAIIKALTTCSVNVGFIGLPLMVSLLGKEAVKPTFLCLITVLLIIFPMAYYLLARSCNGQKEDTLPFLRSLLTNPMLTAPIIGIIISSLAIRLPELIMDYLVMLAAPMTPLAMLAVGYNIEWVDEKSDYQQLLTLTLLKLLIMPAVVFGLAVALGNEPFNVIILVLIAALPTAKTVLVISHSHASEYKTVSNVITLSTLLCPVTIALWLIVLKYCYHSEWITFLSNAA
ncbi:MAG: AEC family transporter [Gammaproteobacteria bacterium]|nr:AEC family transporter [Gammaproteobacteria bacterium]